MTKTSSRKVTSKVRREQALLLRRSGLSYTRIGEQMGITRQAAHALVKKALAEIQASLEETGKEIITLEVERLDRMTEALWDKVIDGDTTAIEKNLKIMERRAKLLGLDSPTKIAPTDPSGKNPYDGISEAERDQRIIAILEQAAAKRAAGAQ